MENKQIGTVPIIAFEDLRDSLMRVIKWLIVIDILLLVLFAGSNLAWVVYENSFQDVETTTVTQEAETDGDILQNGIGDMSYGSSETNGN